MPMTHEPQRDPASKARHGTISSETTTRLCSPPSEASLTANHSESLLADTSEGAFLSANHNETLLPAERGFFFFFFFFFFLKKILPYRGQSRRVNAPR